MELSEALLELGEALKSVWQARPMEFVCVRACEHVYVSVHSCVCARVRVRARACACTRACVRA